MAQQQNKTKNKSKTLDFLLRKLADQLFKGLKDFIKQVSKD